MNLRTAPLPLRLAASGFCLTVLLSLLSALLLMTLTTAPAGKAFPGLEDIATKYATPKLTASLRTSMYEFVTDDDDIERTSAWIAAGMPQDIYEQEIRPFMEADCTSCHNQNSTMSSAAPHMPLTTYEEVLVFTERGGSWHALNIQIHTHLFGIGLLLLAVAALMTQTTLLQPLKVLLIVVGFVGLWLDVGGWVLAKWTESAALLIFGGGAMTVGAIGAMAGLTLLETWYRLPFIGGQDNPDNNRAP